MQIGTQVFRKVVQDREASLRAAAIKAIADTMQETTRFGCFERAYIEQCARQRLNEALQRLQDEDEGA
ncbi:MAG: hypothetical protein M5U26_18735 [Planctomycetota bacterium]|nr:hypothetical protein [Planctomycetota bacterium]